MKTKIIITIFCFVTSLSAHGALVSRLGGQAVYDTDLDITWLSNTNLALTNQFGLTLNTTNAFDDTANTIGSTGKMTWNNANAWIVGMNSANYLGFNDWRLPTANNSDGSGPCSGLNCVGSEMGHLFYNELSVSAGRSILTSADPDLTLFSNIQFPSYWSATEFEPGSPSAWIFGVINGVQIALDKTNNYSAWAVRSGDVSAVPIPAAVWLFSAGLAGLIGMSRRKAVV